MRLRFLGLLCFLSIIGLQLSFAQTNVSRNRAVYQSSAANYDNTGHLTTDGSLTTSWISKTGNTEWIYVDLGAVCRISKINIVWDKAYAKAYRIQTAQAGPPEKPLKWTDAYTTDSSDGGNDQINLKTVSARYVKILCLKPANPGSYAIAEFNVTGTGGPVYVAKPIPAMQADGKQYLTGGNWKLQRAAFVEGKGEDISKLNFKANNWIPATVPGTILTSYFNIGAVPDHNFDDQQLMISDSFFTADFWYRNSFVVPAAYKGKKVWLNFDGINWKADIYINGRLLGNIKGAFIRGMFDVTDYVKVGQQNALAVLIHKNDNPGKVTEQHLNDADPNGGVIGYDSPTFLASIGWNWIPTIRGRNTGIWNDVYLSSTEAVTIDNPFIKTDLNLPDTTKASLSVEVMLTNHSATAVNGILKGTIGAITFNQPVSLQPNEAKKVTLNPATNPQLSLNHPKLWWPNGYGNQPLYNLKLQFNSGNKLSDQKELKFGIRKYTYSYEDNNLHIQVNGFPIIIRGGNWGMAEAMLRCDKAGYDLRVKLHKDMNLNMIRNWIGMVADDEFYDACDKYGIMIWDDFWLANPVDGPAPKDNVMFMANVKDKIYQRRNHAALALWCGRNEGYPPTVLDTAMKSETINLDGTRQYISSSANKPVTGLGPYEIKDPKWYFQNRGITLHSEEGIVVVPPVESMKAMMPVDSLWPISDSWGKHDWTQPRVTIYNNDLNREYGKATSLADFCRKAQMMNMEGPKALMETWQSNRGPGVLVWMTHPAWPSLICQTYDYYFEPTAAYFAFKTANQPLHIQWRADNESVEVANDTRNNFDNLTVEAHLYSLDGKLISSKTVNGNVVSNITKSFFNLVYPDNITPVQFISLKLKNTEGKILSENFYWRGTNYMDYNSLQTMRKVSLTGKAIKKTIGGHTTITVPLTNNSGNVALMTRLKVLQKKSGKRVLPIFYSDNYISLTPGETKTVTITFDNKYLEKDLPKLMIEGWNINEREIHISNN